MAHGSVAGGMVLLLVLVVLLRVMLVVWLVLVFLIDSHLHISMMSSTIHEHTLCLRLVLPVQCVWIMGRGLRNRRARR